VNGPSADSLKQWQNQEEIPNAEDRIRNEVIVDTYNAEEQVMGWYYYL
jgi:hypothetical protein